MDERKPPVANRAAEPKSGTKKRRTDLTYPLSVAQSAIWSAQIQDPGWALTLARHYAIEGPVDPNLFISACQRLVAEFDLYRVAFIETPDGPRQKVRDALNWSPLVRDFRGESDPEFSANFWMRNDLTEPIGTIGEHLFTFALLQIGDNSWLFYQRCHRLLCDEPSFDITTARLAAMYSGLAAGSPLPFTTQPSALTLSHAEQAYRASNDFVNDRAFWREQLARPVEPASLAPKSSQSAVVPPIRHSLELQRGLVEELQDLANTRGASLDDLLTVAVALYLHGLSGSSIISMKRPVLGRSNALRRTPGVAATLLPMRLEIAPTDKIPDLLNAAAAAFERLLPHQRYRYEDLRRDLALPSDAADNFGPTVAVYAAHGTLTWAGQRLQLRNLANTVRIDDFAVSLCDFGERQAPRLYLDGNPELYTTEGLAAHSTALVKLLEQIAANPLLPLEQIELPLRFHESPELVLNVDKTPTSQAGTLVELFERQARKTPNNIALLFEDLQCKYAELDERANRLAWKLIQHGIGPEDFVAICLPRSVEMVVAIIATLKAGAAYLPLDSGYPGERLGFVLADAKPKAVLTTSALRQNLPAQLNGVCVLLDSPESTTEAAASDASVPSDADRKFPLRPNHPAYLIYTSGSTGRPKGVAVTHRNVSRLFDACANWMRFDADDVWTLFHSYAFDFSVWELWGALLHGGRLVIVPHDVARSAEAFRKLLADRRVTVLNQTPSAFYRLIQADEECVSKGGLALRTVIFGGEALDLRRLESWYRLHPDDSPQLVNMYGITETTVHVTCGPLDARIAASADSSLIGAALSDLHAYVLDEHLQPCPDGVVGELYVAGAGLARGYWSRPELTAERFVANPFATNPGERLYRTGDFASWNSDRSLVYHGRADQQIKIRGFRVEPGEIEATLLREPQVGQVVVIAREDTPGDKRLVAYLLLQKEEAAAPVAIDLPNLRERLVTRLPEYMVPSAFVVLRELPLTPNGKLDRKALPAPDGSGLEAGYQAPSSPEEILLCQLVAELIGAESVGLGDNFFHLGGHSLLATRLVAQIRARLGRELPIRAVFDTPLLGDLARALRSSAKAGLALTARTRPAELPLSFAQARLWFLQQLEGPNPSYNIPVAVRLTGALDESALELALRDVLARHESLRTLLVDVAAKCGRDGDDGFPGSANLPIGAVALPGGWKLAGSAHESARISSDAIEGRASSDAPRQLILSAEELASPLNAVDCSPEALAGQLAAITARGFALSTEIPIRATLFRLGAADHALLLVLHHSAADGWSITPLLEDLAAAYSARRQGRAPEFAPLAVQYADYTLWQRELLGNERDPSSAIARQTAYWTEKLAELPAELALPTDRPRPLRPTYAGGTVRFAISAELHGKLEKLCRKQGVTLFMLLEATLAALLSKLSGSTDIPIGSPIAGRTEAALDHLVGFFVNTLVLRTDISGDPSFAELLQRARTTCLEAYAHQDLPFERLVEVLDPPRVLGRQPLFQTMLVLQNNVQPHLDLPGVTASEISVGSRATKFDLSFSFTEQQDVTTPSRAAGLAGELEYSADLFERTSVERIAARLLRLLEQVTDDPSLPLHRIDVLSSEERQQLVGEFNDTAASLPSANLIELFERQVARTPSGVALQLGERQCSYAELEARSNQLAWKLIAGGIGPEDIVAICFERSFEMVVAILATLKAGAAYLPLDPDSPAERLTLLLEDARPKRILTSSALAAKLPESSRELCFSLDAPEVTAELRGFVVSAPTDADRVTPLRPNHPAYLIYTSGSTGVPKGVTISQQSIAHYIDLVGREVLGPNPTMPLFTSAVFDLTLTSLFAPLCFGGTIRILPQKNAQEALEAIFSGEDAPSAIKLTPSHIALLATLPTHAASIRTAIVGGEVLTTAHVKTLEEHCPGIRVFNEYGPTETTIGAVAGFVSADDIPIGKPYANTRAYVLDASFQPCPIGVRGELYIAGIGLARGYWNRPSLTAERFIANPFAQEPGERLYRTGDLASWRDDGNLLFHGRADQQLKIRGFRIEPGEIEAALLRESNIAQATVIARGDAPGEKRLVAYVVARQNEHGQRPSIDLRELRAHLAARLPEYMVPSAFVVLDALPLTTNGKLDRKALPAPGGSGLAAGFVPPSTLEEIALCETVAELLNVDRVGLADNFFHLGGHSLLATRLAARIRTRLGRELPIRTIFESPVLGDLSRALRELSAPTGEAAPLIADPAAAHDPFPLTPVQEAYWLGRQSLIELGEVACHSYVEFHLRSLDLDRLTWTWRSIIDRHPMLRAVVEPSGSQRILDPSTLPPFTIAFADHSSASADEAETAVRGVREEMSHQVLACDRWPLFEVRVTRVAENDWHLHLSLDALILDGESCGLMLQEVFDLYHGRIAPGPLTERTFRDYVLHLQAPSTEKEKAHAYWEARLDSLPPAPALPLAVDPSRLTDPRFGRLHAEIEPAVWNQLKSRAASNGLTPSNLLLTAYTEVLGTWARSDDFTLNLTVGDRRILHSDVATMLGVFTNLTPLEIRGACRGSFRARARTQQQQLAHDLDHRAVSGVEVQRMLAQRAGDPHAGLLPVVFTSVIGESQADLSRDGITEVHSITQTPQTWLDVKVFELGSALGIDWDAPLALFPAGVLEAMFEAFVGLLEELAASEAAWDATDRSLVPAAQSELIAQVNATAGPLPSDLLHEPIFAAAATMPDTIAVIGEDFTLSYRELAARARLLAHELHGLLTPDDQLVAIVMEKGFEQIVAALAVLENGRAFLPISASQPDQRIQTILSQAGVRVALTQPHLRLGNSSGRAAAAGSSDTGSTSDNADANHRTWQDQVVLLDASRSPFVGDVPPRLPQTAKPTDTAYVIYTSGSTGMPKGVTIQHAAARNTIADLTDRWSITNRDRVLWVSSFEFDLSIFDIFGILAAGGTVVVPPPNSHQNPIAWAEAVQQHQVTVWNSVPALAELMLSAAGEHSNRLLASLRLMMLSGDWIPVALGQRIRKELPDCRLFSLGGATEASIWSIFHPIEEVDPNWLSIPYGKPLRNQTFHVLKSDLSLCPIHTTGKLFIGGAGLAAGYRNNPEQTAARFIKHPRTSERLYDTGDLGRYRPDGSIEFLGREDAQVKLRGFRIELGEIEAALLRDPTIIQAAVIAREDTPGDKRLVAYLVRSDNAQSVGYAVDLPALRRRLTALLPDYMVPSAFVTLDALPLTSNGKLDRNALPVPETSGLSAGYLEPSTAAEALLCELVAQLLRLDRVGLADNFFHLGGDSISAIRLVGRTRERELLITPKDVFVHPVLRDLAAAAATPIHTPETSNEVSFAVLTPEERKAFERYHADLEEIWPLTPLQEGLLFHAHYETAGEDPYIVQLVLEFEGTLDPSRLRRALDALLVRHPNLRVSFELSRSGRPLQIVHARRPMPWQEHDLCSFEPEERDRLAAEIEAEDHRARFSLEQAPLIRAILLHLGPEHHRLLLTQHHLLSDGWSSSILLQDLLSFYRHNGDAGALPQQPAFQAYLGWLQHQDQDAARAAWRSYLAGIEEPTRIAPETAKDTPVSQAQFEQHLSVDITAKLDAMARQHGLTLAIVLQGAWSILLAHLTNSNDIVYGNVSSGRQALVPGVERILGLLITTTPARAQLHPSESVVAFLERLQREQAALFPHQYLPLAEIQKLAGERVLFDTLFTYENYPADPPDLVAAADDLPLRAIRGQNSNHYPLSLAVIPGDGLVIRIHYSANRFERTSAERLSARLVCLLEQIAKDPLLPLHRLDLLFTDEQQRIVRDFNDTAASQPQNTLIDLFEQQVGQTPKNIAVSINESEWTYAQLDARANQLAWKLIAEGIGPEYVVAICFERSFEMIVAVLGTWKAGAAYLPLDPEYPAERLAFMLEDARPKCVLTNSTLAKKLPEQSRNGCLLLDASEEAAELSGFAAPAPADADRTTPLRSNHPAYLIYTSGSTGTPKGVVVTHGGLPNLAKSQISRLGISQSSRVVQLASLSFDAAVSEMAMAFCSGATLVLASGNERSGDALAHLLGDQRITHATFTPTVLRTLPVDRTLPLEAIIIAGEPCPAELVATWAPRCLALNAYGPTEATVCATMSCALSAEADPLPIGAPISNARVYVLDMNLRPCPVGVVGELYITGIGLARGYWNRPALTAERFIANPFALDPGERLYRTGDLASWRDDGNLLFHGRADQQLKVRGFRIEPGEIEAVLLREPGIGQAAVVARENVTGDKRLVAYVVRKRVAQEDAVALDMQRLRQTVAATLPDHMVPAAFVALHALPLTPSGKLDRKALLAPDASGLAATYAAPSTQQETLLCKLVAELLGLERVGLADNFFHLGGDSISSIRLVSRARERGLAITPRDVFLYPVMADLALAVRPRMEVHGAVTDVADVAQGVVPPTPIIRRLFSQKARWKKFHQAMLVQIPAQLQEAALIAALQALVDHHDALRLRVTTDGTLLIPPIGAARAASYLRRISLAGLGPADRKQSLQRAYREAIDRLNPHGGAMVQAVWAEDEFESPARLLLVIHHLAVDGVSWRILLPDLAAAYAAAATGKSITFASKSSSFRRWALSLVHSAPEKFSELPFWHQMASAPAPPLLPSRFDRANVELRSAASCVDRALSIQTTSALLTTVPEAFRARINDVLLTALVLACARWRKERGDSGDLALRVDIEGHGREPLDSSIDLARTVGWFTSLFPVHLDPGVIDLEDAFAGGTTAGRALKRIKEQVRSVPHNGLGYGMLRFLDPHGGTELNRYAEPQIAFNYLGRFAAETGANWELAGEDLSLASDSDSTPLDHPLSVDAITYDTLEGPVLRANWRFETALLDEAQANRLADLWNEALEALTRHAAQAGAGGRTPSDFTLVALQQEEIENFEARHPDMEDVWPLTPLQEGLLFHAHYETAGEDPYVVQLVLEFEGTLDPSRLRRALDALLVRHPNLRVSFELSRSGRPLQIVHARRPMPWQEHDLCSFELQEREQLAAEIEAEDHRARFELEQAPLIRATFLHLGPEHHRLLLTQHHLLSDGWSSSILLQDLLSLYRHSGDAGALPQQPAFRAYLGWLQHQDQDAARAAWRSYLAGIEEPTRIAPETAKDTPVSQTQFEQHLSVDITAKLDVVARQHGLTLAIILQGAWSILLARLTNSNDVVYGNVSSGRQALVPGVERILGLLITTTPARAKLHPAESVIVFLERLQREQAALLPHQHLPLAEIHKVAGEQMLFDTLFTYENYPADPLNAPLSPDELILHSVQGQTGNHYPLSLAVIPGEHLELHFNYSVAAFDRPGIERLAGRLVLLLAQIADDPSLPVHRLEVLSLEEQQQLVRGFNDTAAPVQQTTLIDLFEQQVRRASQNIAVSIGESEWTFSQLEERANQLAWKLIAEGVGPEDIVAVCCERSFEMIVAVLATLKAGAAYMPLDPDFPAGRLAFLLDDAQPKLILTASAVSASLPLNRSHLCLVLDSPSFLARLAGYSKLAPTDASRTTRLRPDHAAYVIYTSGSTGVPKGVTISQQSIAHYIDLVGREVLGPNPTMPLFTSAVFDLTLTSLFAPLCFGGTIRILPQRNAQDAIEEIFSGQQTPSVIKLTPSHIALLATLPPHAAAIRTAIVGGEALTATHVKTLEAHCPGIRVFNEYGPTETTIGAIAGYVSADDIPIGKPYANTRVYVLDASLQPCPLGVTGELYIAGIGLARGYWNQPSLTAERFIANPFSLDPGERLYRTGDMACWRDDGNLLFHGRADQQLKIRGFRIEPGEIEAALLRKSNIAQAAVIALEDAPGEKRLVAYVVARRDEQGGAATLDLRELREHLAARLPEYLVPSAFVALEALPLTTNGKLDRKALPAPDSAFQAAYLAPNTPEETLLCELVAELLGLERVGLADNFFHLGGHSLLAARLAAHIRARLDRELPIRTIFENPVLGELARQIGLVTDNTTAFNLLLPIRKSGSLPPLFCLHPVGGLCWPYANLVRHTSPEQPIYGIQARGFAGDGNLPQAVEDVIAESVEQIRSVQPHGPYRLLGWSFGGILAHMTATRLQADGETIDRLILFDSYPPSTRMNEEMERRNGPNGVWRDLAMGTDLRLPDDAFGKPLDAATIYALAQEQFHILGALPFAQLEQMGAVMANNSKIMSRTAPPVTLGRFQGDVLLYVVTRRAPDFNFQVMNPQAWKPYCTGAVRTIAIDSTHNRMLSPDALKQIGILPF